jgi:hypothetical protein
VTSFAMICPRNYERVMELGMRKPKPQSCTVGGSHDGVCLVIVALVAVGGSK